MTLSRRTPLIEYAKTLIPKVCITGVLFDLTVEQAQARDAKRVQETGSKSIPGIAYYSLRSNYVKPSYEEGFTNIIVIKKDTIY